MDVYIGAEAAAALAAEALTSSGPSLRGLLLGHRRGPRYFVERAFPLRGKAFPAETRFRELDRAFGGRVIGFYERKTTLSRYFLQPRKKITGSPLRRKPFSIYCIFQTLDRDKIH